MPPIKRPSRYIKPEGYRTPHEIIQATPQIRTKEAIFTKEKGPFKELIQINKPGTSETASCSPYSIKYTLFHTHPLLDKKSIPPSRRDLVTFFKLYTKTGKNNQGIGIINPKTGEEVGRTHFTFTNKTLSIINEEYKKYIANKNNLNLKSQVDYIQSLLFDEMLRSKLGPKFNLIKVMSLGLLSPNITYANKKYIKILEDKFGIKVRFVPMPGYKFNPDKVIFERI